MQRFYLSLSSFSGIVPGAKHWWCRVRWTDASGARQEADAEHGRGIHRTGSFDSKEDARLAGCALARKLAAGALYVVTEGSHSVIDPQEVLSASPGCRTLKQNLNVLWHTFEKLGGWNAPKSKWPVVQDLCDAWTRLIDQK